VEAIRAQLAEGVKIEIWFQDEARIGQKNKITRRWARRGTRPSAPHDLRTKSAYLFGAICPATGEAIGLVLPWCNTAAMNAHLAEISAAVDPGAHAVLLLDQAAWHTTKKLRLPANITILPLPAKAPELNPTENIWQFIRDNWLSNRIFESYEQIVQLCCDAWNKLRDQPWRVMSIGHRNWAHA
jgi:DDE superfamily endonuclease